MNTSSVTNLPRSIARSHRRSGEGRRWWLAAPSLLLALILGIAAAYSLTHSSHIFPGVRALGVDIGGMTRPQAEAAIASRARADLERPIDFDLADRGFVRISARELGLSYDVGATVDEALRVGRTGNWFSRWATRIGAPVGGHHVAPVTHYRPASAAVALQRIAVRVDQPMRNAALALGADGPRVTRSQVGLRLNVTATLAQLSTSLQALYLDRQPIQPVIARTPPVVADAQIAAASRQLATAWNRPLRATFAGRAFELPPTAVRGMLDLRGEAGSRRPVLEETRLANWVRTEIAARVDRDARDATIEVLPGTVRLVPGRTAYETDQRATVRRLSATAVGNSGSVGAAVRVTPPAITDAMLRPAVDRAHAMVSRPLQLQLGGRSWTLTPSELTELLRWQGDGAQRKTYLAPEGVRRWVATAAGQVDTAPKDARLELRGERVALVPDVNGIAVDQPATLRAILDAVAAPAGRAALATKTLVADVRGADLTGAQALANRLIGNDVALTHGGKRWIADRADLRAWLSWKGEGRSVSPYLAQERVEEFIEDVADDVAVAATDASVVRSAERLRLVPHTLGLAVKDEAAGALVGALARAPRGERIEQVPTEGTLPELTTAGIQREYDRARRWTDGRFYLTLGERMWWLDTEDVSNAVRWEDGGFNPSLSVSRMENELRQFIGQPQDILINYTETAEDIVQRLLDGSKRSVEVTRRVVDTPGVKHFGARDHWGGNFPAKWIDVDLGTQTMAAYEGGNQVNVTLVTSGRPELPTPTGVFRIIYKQSPRKLYSPWPKGSPFYYEPLTVRYVLNFKHGGFHIHDSAYRTFYGPGSNTSGIGSRGCVGTPPSKMRWFYDWARVGTPVIIHW